jgi:hypothetical protein
MPTARRCQGCGATLGEAAVGASVVTCQFCGLAHDSTVAFSAVHASSIVVEAPERARRANRIIVGVVLVVVAVIMVSALVPAVLGLHMAQTAVGLSSSNVTARLTDGRRPIPPAALASAPQGGGWKVLATTTPEGGFTDFDPIGSLPWAMAIGRAWASDAVLTRIDVGRVSATGAVDLGGEQSSGYRFVSPAQRAVAADANQPAARRDPRACAARPRLRGQAVLLGLPDSPAPRRLGLVLPCGRGSVGVPARPRPRRPRLSVLAPWRADGSICGS